MLARQMDLSKLGYVKADNCFLDLADPPAAQKLADQQLALDWPAQLNRLLTLAHPVHRQVLAPLFGLEVTIGPARRARMRPTWCLRMQSNWPRFIRPLSTTAL